MLVIGVYCRFMRWKSKKQITVRFLHRTMLFMTALSTGLLAFYYFGNIQQFLDETLQSLLRILSAISLCTCVLGLILFLAECSILFHRKKAIYLILGCIALFCVCYAGLITLFTRSVLLLSNGMFFTR